MGLKEEYEAAKRLYHEWGKKAKGTKDLKDPHDYFSKTNRALYFKAKHIYHELGADLKYENLKTEESRLANLELKGNLSRKEREKIYKKRMKILHDMNNIKRD